MEIPWPGKINEKEKRIRELEERIENLQEEKERLEKRFEAEQDRRAKLSREKQDAEEELNRMRDRLESIHSEEETQEDREAVNDYRELDFGEARRLFEKLSSVESPEKDLVTVYSPETIEEVGDLKGLKNAASGKKISELRSAEGFTAFFDETALSFIIKTRTFFEAEWRLGKSFHAGRILDFIESEKTWVLVSAGETEIFREESGKFEKIESVKSRVDRQHSKGGFSQGRFERKREEQIEEHIEEVKDNLEELENIYLLGDQRLCEELPGEHLGGFDPNQKKPEQFYDFRLVRIN